MAYYSMALPRIEGKTAPLLNLRAMIEKNTRVRRHRLMLFRLVLERCHRRIQAASAGWRTALFFEVPREIIGSPSFPYEHLVSYLVHNLRENGFLVSEWRSHKWTNLVWLHISWHPDVIDVEAYDRATGQASSSSSEKKPREEEWSDIMLELSISDLQNKKHRRGKRLSKKEREAEDEKNEYKQRMVDHYWRELLPETMRET